MKIRAFAACWWTCAFVMFGADRALAADAPAEIVLYAADAVKLRGNWAHKSDSTAAGGQALVSADRGWSRTKNPRAAPTDTLDFTFQAPAGVSYRLWIRMRAYANSTSNDSLWAQFSDAVTPEGSPSSRVGTNEGLLFTLEACKGCGVKGWGWSSGAYWLTQPVVRFAESGSHTLRLQTREDGVRVDQIVLSPAVYVSSAPGSGTADHTIVVKPLVRSPYLGQLAAVPGTIEAENFDEGGEGLGYHDTTPGNAGGAYRTVDVDLQPSTEGGYSIGWIEPGEWVNYSVSVASAGTYLLDARVAAFGQGGTFHVEADGRDITGAMTVPDTGGWQNWTTISKTVSLSAGPQVLRVVFDLRGAGAVGNVNWIRLSSKPPQPYTGTAVSLPGTLRAENFDDGGEGVAYHDATAGNSGGQKRLTDVDIESSSLGGFNVGWISDGEWLGYSVNVATAGTYSLQLRVASPSATGRIRAVLGSISSDTVAIPNTGGWQIWTTVALTAANLPAGPGFLKLVFEVGGFNIADVVVALVQQPLPALAPAPSPLPDPQPVDPIAPGGYSALSDRMTRPKPGLPTLGPAGYRFTDPAFGSTLVRLTDASTRPGAPNRSYRTPSASHQVAWNSTSNYFYLLSTDGTIVPYSLNGATGSASRIPSATGDGGLTLLFAIEPEFSSTQPNRLYGALYSGGTRTISHYDFSSGSYTSLVNLDTLVANLAGTYVGGLAVGGAPSEKMMVFFGGTSQDRHYYALWFPTADLGARKLVDTIASTINGRPTNVLLNFRLHSASIDKSGRYVFLYPTAGDLGAPRYASQVYIWDSATDVFTALSSGGNDGGPDAHPGGHDAPGFDYSVNHDCCVSSSWDAGQWLLRTLATPLDPWDLIKPVQTPQQIYLSDHPSWNNARPDRLVPFISGTYRYGQNTAPWRAWDDEIVAVQTDAAAGAIVWRFAHHRSLVASDTDPTALYFWYEPRPNVSPDGRWVIFTSNWEKTLGIDPGTGTYRQDVFLLALQPAP